ncbi:MAG: TetR/AcrR family transcriptional regulator [Gammaproteobacteria bacterium]
MTTRDTQKLILDTAIDLFNRHGTAQISSNRIADTCALSRGHLYYHFKRKEEIISAIYDRIVAEIKYNWGDDLQKPTLQHMLEMFDRHLALIWQYRFFYRELTALLAADEHLRERYGRDRQDRTRVVIDFFQALVDHDVLTGPRDARTLRGLVRASWIICDNWINYLSVDRPAVYPDCVQEGSQVVIDLFRPYLSPRTLSMLDNPAPEPARARSRN